MTVASKRNYKKEYANYHSKPEQIARRSARNKSVRKLKREGKGSKDGKDVDHKNRNPMDRSDKNLRVISRKKNRSRNS